MSAGPGIHLLCRFSPQVRSESSMPEAGTPVGCFREGQMFPSPNHYQYQNLLAWGLLVMTFRHNNSNPKISLLTCIHFMGPRVLSILKQMCNTSPHSMVFKDEIEISEDILYLEEAAQEHRS